MTSDIGSTGQLYSLLGWVDKNRKQIVSTAVILAVVAFALFYFRWRGEQRRIQGGEALSAVLMDAGPAGPGSEVLFKVANDYAGTEAGARALLRAGEQLFAESKIAEAQSAFSRFVGEYAESPLLSQAKLGVAVCLESQGKTTEAAAAFKEVADRFPDKNTANLAKFHLAGIHEAQGKAELARDMYLELVRDGQSTIGSEAIARLTEMFEKNPALRPGAVSTPPPALSTAAP